MYCAENRKMEDGKGRRYVHRNVDYSDERLLFLAYFSVYQCFTTPPPKNFEVYMLFSLKKGRKRFVHLKKMFFICIVVRVKIMLKHRHGQKE